MMSPLICKILLSLYIFCGSANIHVICEGATEKEVKIITYSTKRMAPLAQSSATTMNYIGD